VLYKESYNNAAYCGIHNGWFTRDNGNAICDNTRGEGLVKKGRKLSETVAQLWNQCFIRQVLLHVIWRWMEYGVQMGSRRCSEYSLSVIAEVLGKWILKYLL
jgi:hypothetical protein